MNPILKDCLGDIARKAIAFCGGGLSLFGITAEHQNGMTAMFVGAFPGIAITVLSYLWTRAAKSKLAAKIKADFQASILGSVDAAPVQAASIGSAVAGSLMAVALLGLVCLPLTGCDTTSGVVTTVTKAGAAVTAAPTASAVATEAQVAAGIAKYAPQAEATLTLAESLYLQFGITDPVKRTAAANKVYAIGQTIYAYQGVTGADGKPVSISAIIAAVAANYQSDPPAKTIGDAVGVFLGFVSGYVPDVALYLPEWNSLLGYAAKTLEDGASAYITPSTAS